VLSAVGLVFELGIYYSEFCGIGSCLIFESEYIEMGYSTGGLSFFT